MTNEPFLPTKSEKVKALLATARQHNAALDEIDRKNGHGRPQDCTLDLHLRTVICAIVFGLEHEDWSSVAEGLEMLQQAELRVRGNSP